MLIKACQEIGNFNNTGIECKVNPGVLAMLLAMPITTKLTEQQMSDLHTSINTYTHASVGSRWYPLFGYACPIRGIDNAKENDTTATLDDGTKVFIRRGVYNKKLTTNEGGLSFVKKLDFLRNSGYGVMEVDEQGQLLCLKNDDDTYSPINIDYMNALSPDFADMKNPFKNGFEYSYSPTQIIKRGFMFSGADFLLQKTGLIDCKLLAVANSSVANSYSISALTLHKEVNPVNTTWNGVADKTIWKVLDSNGVSQTINTVTFNSTENLFVFDMTLASGTYTIVPPTAAQLLSKSVSGFEIIKSASLTV